MKEVWRRTLRPGPVLVLEERLGARGSRTVYARWWCRRPGSARSYWRKRSLGVDLRDAHGAIRAEVERSVLDRGRTMHEVLRVGRDPMEVPLTGALELTVSEGLRRYLEVGDGAFAGDSRHRRDLVRAGKQLATILGDTPWVRLRAGTAPRVWRTMAHDREGVGGVRWTERVVGLLLSTDEWLAEQELLPGRHRALRQHGWRARLRLEWSQLKGRAAPGPARPRYTLDEAQALWRALDRGADPLLQLAMLIGAPEHRLGMVLRVRRSDLDLSFAQGFGSVLIPGQGNKGGGRIVLDKPARRALDAALTTGCLRDLEAAYRSAGTDYSLLPGGRAVTGVYPVGADPLRHLSLTALRARFRALEAAAGVSHLRGRGWHGLRRLASDLCSGLSEDCRTLDALQGFAPGTTRERIYLDRAANDVRARADALRKELRRMVQGHPTPAGDPSLADRRAGP